MEPTNKPLPTKIKIGISFGLLSLILIGFNQCILKDTSGPVQKKPSLSNSSRHPLDPETRDASDIGESKDLPDGVDMPPLNTPVDEKLAQMDVGVKNFEQINLSMSALTGIAPSDNNVQSVYNDISIQLPSTNDIKSFLPSTQVAITKLATEYCDRLIETGAKKATIWPSINFAQNPNQTFTAANKTALIDQTVSYFMGPITADQEAQAKAELMSLYNSLIAGESLTANATTKKVVKGLCTAALGSAYVTLL